jgi:hypothetical protein
VWEEGDEIICIASSPAGHHAQEWAIEANKCKQAKTKLPMHYQRHVQLFSEQVAWHFLPSQPKNLHIQIKPGTPDTINCKVYPLTHSEGEASDKFIEENEKLEHIEKSNSPWSTPVFFIKKKDGSYHPVQDYCMVNSWTERDVYPMPWIEQILEQLHRKVLFTALDIQDGYNNIQVHPEDWWKLVFKSSKRSMATQGHVLQNDQCSHSLPKNHGPSVWAPEEQVPRDDLCVYGQHPDHHPR